MWHSMPSLQKQLRFGFSCPEKQRTLLALSFPGFGALLGRPGRMKAVGAIREGIALRNVTFEVTSNCRCRGTCFGALPEMSGAQIDHAGRP